MIFVFELYSHYSMNLEDILNWLFKEAVRLEAVEKKLAKQKANKQSRLNKKIKK